MRPRHVSWAREAALRMPLPTARIELVTRAHPDTGGPAYRHDFGPTLYLPAYPRKPGWERAYFLHELGHAADRHGLTAQERRQWTIAAGIPHCSWWKPCPTRRYTTTVEIEPYEMFAEHYFACAAGTTRRAIEDAMLPTYGWLPNPATEKLLCWATSQWLAVTRPEGDS